MAGHPTYTAVLDACVLYPICVADALMSMAVANLYAAKWTEKIESEWMRNLEADRPDLQGRLGRRRDLMRQAVPDWEVSDTACQLLVPCLKLPDMGDVHVLAAAIAGNADCIVTTNLKDFPNDALEPFRLCAIHPDEFLVAQFDLHQIRALESYKEMRARCKNNPLSPDDFADTFERNGLAAMATRLRDASALI